MQLQPFSNLVIDDLHDRAMEAADQASLEKAQGRLEAAQGLFLRAFEYESAAAMILVNSYDQEPTRAVLFRSAASLLLHLPDSQETHFRQAERMITFGLSGNPPEEIAEELREVWKTLWNLFQ